MKYLAFITAAICLILVTMHAGFAQVASPSPVPGVVVDLNSASQGVSVLSQMLVDKAGLIGTILGVMFMLSKAISTEKAPILVSLIQQIFDGAASLMLALGDVLKKMSAFLANLLASDGTLGKK